MSRRRARTPRHTDSKLGDAGDALPRRAPSASNCRVDPPDHTTAATLLSRARRLAREGDYRKAALALRELTAHQPDARSYALLGDMLRRAGRDREAIAALKEAMWRQRQAGASGRVRTLARMILAIDPSDAKVARLAA